jgi:HlyD family secretion protein
MANSKSKRGRKILIFALIVVVLGGLTALAVFRKKEAVITVQTEKVGRRNLTEVVVANGRIYPVFQVKISPEVSGEIIELPVKEGQKVKKGDLLLKIKPDVYVAQKNSSEASYKSAVSGKVTAAANLKRAELDYNRIKALHASHLVSDSDSLAAQTSFEVAQAQLESAEHQVEMADAALKRVDEDLSKTTIVSPLDGTVSRLNSQLGERVVGTAMMAGTEVMTIADLNEMEARVDIGETDVVLIQSCQNARLEVDAFKDRKFGGAVTEIANSSKAMGFGGGGGGSQEATKFEVKIRIRDKEPFRPGMSVTAEVETRSRTNVLTVPLASVTTRMPKPPGDGKKGGAGTNAPPAGKTKAAGTNATATGTNSAVGGTNTVAGGTNAASGGGTNQVGVAPGKKPGDAPKPIEVVFVKEGDRVKMVPVKLGISDDAYTEITEGLQEGQEVVSGGYMALRKDLEDGKKVRIGPAPGEKDKDKGKESEKK